MVEIENENKLLRGKLDRRFGKSTLDDAKLGSLIDLISKIGFSNEDNENDMLGEVYEYFLGNSLLLKVRKVGSIIHLIVLLKHLSILFHLMKEGFMIHVVVQVECLFKVRN